MNFSVGLLFCTRGAHCRWQNTFPLRPECLNLYLTLYLPRRDLTPLPGSGGGRGGGPQKAFPHPPLGDAMSGRLGDLIYVQCQHRLHQGGGRGGDLR